MTAHLPGDLIPGSEGHRTLEILEVIKLFEAADIACCVVGISALKYCGAWGKQRLFCPSSAAFQLFPDNYTGLGTLHAN